MYTKLQKMDIYIEDKITSASHLDSLAWAPWIGISSPRSKRRNRRVSGPAQTVYRKKCSGLQTEAKIMLRTKGRGVSMGGDGDHICELLRAVGLSFCENTEYFLWVLLPCKKLKNYKGIKLNYVFDKGAHTLNKLEFSDSRAKIH